LVIKNPNNRENACHLKGNGADADAEWAVLQNTHREYEGYQTQATSIKSSIQMLPSGHRLIFAWTYPIAELLAACQRRSKTRPPLIVTTEVKVDHPPGLV
jgi:hypothetical protein